MNYAALSEIFLPEVWSEYLRLVSDVETAEAMGVVFGEGDRVPRRDEMGVVRYLRYRPDVRDFRTFGDLFPGTVFKTSAFPVVTESPVFDSIISLVHEDIYRWDFLKYKYVGYFLRTWLLCTADVTFSEEMLFSARGHAEMDAVTRFLRTQNRGRDSTLLLDAARDRAGRKAPITGPLDLDRVLVVDYFSLEHGLSGLPESEFVDSGGTLILVVPVDDKILFDTSGRFHDLEWSRSDDIIRTAYGSFSVDEYAELMMSPSVNMGGCCFSVSTLCMVGTTVAVLRISTTPCAFRTSLVVEPLIIVDEEGRRHMLDATRFVELYESVSTLPLEKLSRGEVLGLTARIFPTRSTRVISCIARAVYLNEFINRFEYSSWVYQVDKSLGSKTFFLTRLAMVTWEVVKVASLLTWVIFAVDRAVRFLRDFGATVISWRVPVIKTFSELRGDPDVLVLDVEESREVAPVSGKSLLLVNRMLLAAGQGSMSREVSYSQQALVTGQLDTLLDAKVSVDPVAVFNELTSQLMPDAAVASTPFHGELVHGDELGLEQPVIEMKLNPYDAREYTPREYFVSRVAGSQSAPKRQTLVELLRSLSDRNLDVPKVSEDIHLDDMFRTMLDFVGDALFVPNWRAMGESFRARPFDIDLASIVETVERLPNEKRDALLQGEVVEWEWMEPQKLRVTVKSTQKPKAKLAANYPGSQTVVFNFPETNLAASPFFMEAEARLKSLFKANVRMGSGMSPEEVGEWASRFTRTGEHNFEADISKFDKSEGENVIMGLERRLYAWLGGNTKFLDRWFEGQEEGTMSAVAFAFKLVTDIQRRSGQRTTLLGNNIVAKFTVIYFFRITADMINWCFSQGDDVIVATNKPVDYSSHIEQWISWVTNLMVKPEWFRFGYCCSRFFVKVGGRMYWVYDPVLMVIKLTRPITVREEAVLVERRESYKELVSGFGDPGVQHFLALAMCERYGTSYRMNEAVIQSCREVVRDATSFRSIWEKKKTIIGY